MKKKATAEHMRVNYRADTQLFFIDTQHIFQQCLQGRSLTRFYTLYLLQS